MTEKRRRGILSKKPSLYSCGYARWLKQSSFTNLAVYNAFANRSSKVRLFLTLNFRCSTSEINVNISQEHDSEKEADKAGWIRANLNSFFK